MVSYNVVLLSQLAGIYWHGCRDTFPLFLFFSYFDTLCSFARLFDERLLCTPFLSSLLFLYPFLRTFLRNSFCFSQIGHMALYAHHHTILSHGHLA